MSILDPRFANRTYPVTVVGGKGTWTSSADTPGMMEHLVHLQIHLGPTTRTAGGGGGSGAYAAGSARNGLSGGSAGGGGYDLSGASKNRMLAHNQVVMGVMGPVTVAVAVAEHILALDLMQEHGAGGDIHQQFYSYHHLDQFGVEVVEGPLTLVVVLNQVLRVDPVVMVEVVVDQMKDLEVDQVESDLVMDGLEDHPIQNQTVVDTEDLDTGGGGGGGGSTRSGVGVPSQTGISKDITVRRQHGALLEEMVVRISLSSDMSYLQTMI